MEPYSVFKRAISAHQNSDFDNALKNYSILLDDKDLFRKLAPKNQEACLLNSSSLMRKFKNHDEAIKLLNDYLLRIIIYLLISGLLHTTILATII